MENNRYYLLIFDFWKNKKITKIINLSIFIKQYLLIWTINFIFIFREYIINVNLMFLFYKKVTFVKGKL